MTNSYGYEGFIDAALGAALAGATTDEIPLLPYTTALNPPPGFKGDTTGQ